MISPPETFAGRAWACGAQVPRRSGAPGVGVADRDRPPHAVLSSAQVAGGGPGPATPRHGACSCSTTSCWSGSSASAAIPAWSRCSRSLTPDQADAVRARVLGEEGYGGDRRSGCAARRASSASAPLRGLATLRAIYEEESLMSEFPALRDALVAAEAPSPASARCRRFHPDVGGRAAAAARLHLLPSAPPEREAASRRSSSPLAGRRSRSSRRPADPAGRPLPSTLPFARHVRRQRDGLAPGPARARSGARCSCGSPRATGRRSAAAPYDGSARGRGAVRPVLARPRQPGSLVRLVERRRLSSALRPGRRGRPAVVFADQADRDRTVPIRENAVVRHRLPRRYRRRAVVDVPLRVAGTSTGQRVQRPVASLPRRVPGAARDTAPGRRGRARPHGRR